MLGIDSTAATPVFTRPLALGADIVMHSATKYLNGHSDVIAGALAAAQDSALWTRIRQVRGHHGAILGPFEAWLLLRGLRTLEVRVKAAGRRRRRCWRQRFANHACGLVACSIPACRRIPATRSRRNRCPASAACCRSASRAASSAAIDRGARVELWKRATSLGGVESLIEHRASIEGAGSPCPPDLLRLSVGLEDVDDLYSGSRSRAAGGEWVSKELLSIGRAHRLVAFFPCRPRSVLS